MTDKWIKSGPILHRTESLLPVGRNKWTFRFRGRFNVTPSGCFELVGNQDKDGYADKIKERDDGGIKLCPREQAGLCTGDEPCPHDCRKPGWECGLEDAALEAAEQYQLQVITPEEEAKHDCPQCRNRKGCPNGQAHYGIQNPRCKTGLFEPELPPAMPEGGTDVMR